MRRSLYILYKAADNTVEHDGIEMSGYLAFLEMLAIFPFIVLLVAVAGVLGQGEAGKEFINIVVGSLPPEAVGSIMPRIDEILNGPPRGLVSVSILGAIWTSSSAVEGLRLVLNRAYDVSNPPTFWWRRMMSVIQLVLFVIVLLVITLVVIFLPQIFIKVELLLGQELPPEADAMWEQYLLYISGSLFFLIVANLYYILPNIKQSLYAVVPGAILVVLMWVLAGQLFVFYLQNVDQVNLIYGSLGGIIATLLFLFIMNVIFIYGAEFNHLLIVERGEQVEEREHVEPGEEEEGPDLAEHGEARKRSRPKQE